MPEPVTTAILAALAVAGSETVKLAVGEAYAGLRSLVVRKLGSSSSGVEALAKLEEDPTSAGWKETTIKELAKAGVDQDPELVVAAEKVMAKLQEVPQGERQQIMPTILAALAMASSEAVKLAVGEAYAGLRSLLVRKLGGGSSGVEALAKLEEDPTSAGWKETTVKELAKAGVDQDPELVAAAEQVLAKLQELPQGERQQIMQAVGSYIAQADRGGTATTLAASKTLPGSAADEP
jgi:hypothetical protein